MRLQRLLVLVPEVYADLATAAVPSRTGEPPDSTDPRERPAPGNLTVMEHRHKLVRGLRWWVDAVDDGTERGGPVGESVARMAAYLLYHSPVMAPEDRTELAGNLSDWLDGAWPLTGDVAPPAPPRLPAAALARVVPVHVAAEALGVSVSTVKRRTPGREGGQVLLGEAAGPLCDRSGLPPVWCGDAHCMRTGCALGA